jgi:hypothetical protein
LWGCFAHLHWGWLIVYFFHPTCLMWNTPNCWHKRFSLAL